MKLKVYIAAIIFLLALTGCGNASPVGKWQQGSDAVHTLELMQDGTAVSTQGSVAAIGKWREVSDNRILFQIEMHGTTGGMYAHMDGDELVIDDNPPMRLHRVSQ